MVIGHVNTKGFLVQWLYTFHMPLFFALSGYILYKFGKYIPFREFLLKRTKSIFWPFILFRFLLFIYWIVIESHFRDFDMGPIWFLIILYLAELVAYPIFYNKKSNSFWIVFVCCLVAVLWFTLKLVLPANFLSSWLLRFLNGLMWYILGYVCGIVEQDIRIISLALKDIYSFGTENSSFYVSQFEGNSKFVGLWDGLVNKSDMRIRNAVIKFVKEQECDSICSFVGRYPSTVDEFLSDEAFARKLWTGVLFNCKYNESGFWNLLEKIILRNMVPDVEKEDFNNSLFKRIGKNIPSERKKILEKTDYFSRLREVLLSVLNYEYSDGINFANANCHQFVKFIKVCGLDARTVLPI